MTADDDRAFHDQLHEEGGRALVDYAVGRLREHGERVTPARRAILEVIADRPEHLSADDVAAELADRGIHRTTVYRTLECFSALGILVHRQLPGEAAAYHLASTGHLHGHCLNCDAVVALPPEDFAGLVRGVESSRGFQLDLHRSTIAGLCERCRRR